MKHDDFEQQLRREAFRRIPEEWRGDILSNAVTSVANRQPSGKSPAKESLLLSPWRDLFWPCPEAWGALAAVWVVVLLLNIQSRPAQAPLAKQQQPSPADTMMAVAERRREIAELLNIPSSVPVPKTRLQRPRSQTSSAWRIG